MIESGLLKSFSDMTLYAGLGFSFKKMLGKVVKIPGNISVKLRLDWPGNVPLYTMFTLDILPRLRGGGGVKTSHTTSLCI